MICITYLVGTAGFEPATPCPPDKYATRLRYAPTHCIDDTTRQYYKSKAVFLTEFVWLFNWYVKIELAAFVFMVATKLMAEVVE